MYCNSQLNEDIEGVITSFIIRLMDEDLYQNYYPKYQDETRNYYYDNGYNISIRFNTKHHYNRDKKDIITEHYLLLNEKFYSVICKYFEDCRFGYEQTSIITKEIDEKEFATRELFTDNYDRTEQETCLSDICNNFGRFYCSTISPIYFEMEFYHNFVEALNIESRGEIDYVDLIAIYSCLYPQNDYEVKVLEVTDYKLECCKMIEAIRKAKFFYL